MTKAIFRPLLTFLKGVTVIVTMIGAALTEIGNIIGTLTSGLIAAFA